jgi:Skp family chaperone for outer membrane proteins
MSITKPTLALGLALLLAGEAAAQTPTPPGLGGAPVPGVCLLSQQAVLAGSKVGQAATARLQALAQQVESQLDTERTALQSDAKALQAQQASLKPADFQARQQALGGRLQTLQQETAQRQRQIEATRIKALGRISQEAQPVIAAAYKAHACGLLLDRGVVLGGNTAGDLTAAVTQGLDARITTLTFDLEPPPPASAAGRP